MYQLYRNGEFENVVFESKTRAITCADTLIVMRACYKIDVVDMTTGEIVYERGI